MTGVSRKGGSPVVSPIANSLKNIRDAIVKTYGPQVIAEAFSEGKVAKAMVSQVKTWFPTELRHMDRVLGRKGHGLPSGKLIELFGSEGQGKSTLGYYLLGEVQRLGGIAALIDTEQSYDPDWAKILGINTEELLVFPTYENSCLEGNFDIIEDVSSKIRANKRTKNVPVCWMYDTIYCSVTHEQLKSKSYKDTQRMAALSRALSSHLPSLCNFLAKKDIGMLFINQVRDNIGVKYGEKLKTPGGHALLHMCTVRAQVKRIHKLEGGIESVVQNHKNKIGVPFKATRIEIGAFGLKSSTRKEQKYGE